MCFARTFLAVLRHSISSGCCLALAVFGNPLPPAKTLTATGLWPLSIRAKKSQGSDIVGLFALGIALATGRVEISHEL